MNIKGAGSDKLTYLWYVYVHEDGSYSEEYKFLSKKEKLKIYNVTQVKRYKCVVSDGIEKKSIELLVEPKEKLDLCAENLAHAKVLTENAPCSAGTYNAENVYMLFTPDKSGL